MSSRRSLHRVLCLCAGLSFIGRVSADEPTAAQLEFFEKQVRPLLVEQCHKCHGPKLQKGGLRLDSRAAALKGGDTGPAVEPGNLKASLLIDAISYDPDSYQMPPTGKLAPEQIAILTEWVRLGAPWPNSASTLTTEEKKFDLSERAKHWSFQPIGKPKIPGVESAAFLRNPIDGFLQSRLESRELPVAKLAEPAIQMRRLSIELTGFQPTPSELNDFLSDAAPDAYERLSDRLLASPRYGERWARHWLDLVRYAETYGHEFDYDIRFPRPYRDYVIRAWNADVPYDQFVREHVAGDLLTEPRRDPSTGLQESVIGTAFWWFGQGKHSPVDIRSEECDTVDNQLDVFGKTFLGLTIACARCHDHKFDPITQKDYYALAGFLQSSRQSNADLNRPEVTKNLVADLERHDQSHRSAVVSRTLDRLQTFVDRLPDRLLSQGDVDRKSLEDWHKRIKDEAQNDPRHPLHLWVHWSADPKKLPQQKASLDGFLRQFQDAKSAATLSSPLVPPSVSLMSPEENNHWLAEGFAFDLRERSKLQWLMQSSAERPVRGVIAPQVWAHSGGGSPKLQGTLRSPTFTIENPYIDFLAYRRGGSPNPLRGDFKAGQIHLIVDGFQIIKDPLYGMLTTHVAQRETPVWYRRDVRRFLGSRAYIEIEDLDDGEIVVEQIQLTDQGLPPQPFNEFISRPLAAAKIDTLADVANIYRQSLQKFLESLRTEERTGAPAVTESQQLAAADLINWLLREEALSNPTPANDDVQFAERRRQLEAAIPTPQRTMAITRGSPENEHLLIRGNHKKPGEEVPRRFLEVFHAEHHPGITREDLANQLADGTNPLPARVIVNRLWQHQFGRGLVSTPDDFGKMGQPPSHPELLDWLAAELITAKWSLKRIQRLLVTSHAFRMSSELGDSVTETHDPENLLLHRANIQRMEAEALRDSLLLMSGRLDDRMYGNSVLPHLTEFMEGRGRPGGGPLDGDGRRSLYVNVRRNFLSPMFLAFDFPTPFTTMGRRSTSNVPAQALTLMNNPFVLQQAQLWVVQVGPALPAEERIRRLYLTAFSRPATDAEVTAGLEFLQEQAKEYGSPQDPRAWTDLAHVLLNVKEFVFVE